MQFIYEMQKIIFPFESLKWNAIKTKIDVEIESTVQLDSLFVSIHDGKFKARTILDMFRKYYDCGDSQLELYSEEHVLKVLFPLWRRLLLGSKKIFKNPIHVLSEGTCNQQFTRTQVATILTFAWFGLMEITPKVSRGPVKLKQLPRFCLLDVFKAGNIHTLHAFLRYFTIVAENLLQEEFTRSIVVVYRRKLPAKPNWRQLNKPISEVYLADAHSENLQSELDYIFELCPCANMLCKRRFGVDMNYEEIMFLMHPEAIVASLICTGMMQDEAILVLGAQKTCKINGYGGSAKYACSVDDMRYGYGDDGRELMLQTALICIDASSKLAGIEQHVDTFDRDLTKAYAGFSALNFHDIVMASHWSTILFTGNLQVKFIQLLLAASASDKKLLYLVQSRDFDEKVNEFMRWIEGDEVTCGQLIEMYQAVISKRVKGNRFSEIDIFGAIMDL